MNNFRLIALPLAALLTTAAPAALAANCSVDLEGSDAMQFNLKNIEVSKACPTFTIHLKHSGKTARNVMGHNVVVALASDMQGIDADGIKAGLDADYIKAADSRVVAHSKVVGGGESTMASFSPAKLSAAGPYAFFCSFPGHAALMKGTISLVP